MYVKMHGKEKIFQAIPNSPLSEPTIKQQFRMYTITKRDTVAERDARSEPR